MGNCMRKPEIAPRDSVYRKITLDDFVVQRAIGKGAFGKVSIVQKKKTGEVYALKYINKAKCVAEKAVHHVVQERNLLQEIKHPFICNLRYSFQDSENLYMALDLMSGGDLRFHLGRPIREDAAKHILAEIASALDFLHMHRIVHRDIKPDNILLDENGHAYLTDFNIAVKFRDDRPLKSVAGTEPYMAPELLLGQGYFYSVDWWSLGVMAYEMVFAERPFRGKHKRDLIKKGDWRFPRPPLPGESATSSTGSTVTSQTSSRSRTERRHENRYPRVSDHCKSFIAGLMTYQVTKRLGVGEEGKEAMRQHPFFADISWEKLMKKESTPLFCPPKNKANYDASHDLEEILLNENPLGTKTKSKKMDPGALSPEMMMIERQFAYYDWSHPDYIDLQEPTSAPPASGMDLVKLRESSVSVDNNRPISTNPSMSMIKSKSVFMSGHATTVPDPINNYVLRPNASGTDAHQTIPRAMSGVPRDDGLAKPGPPHLAGPVGSILLDESTAQALGLRKPTNVEIVA
ncbi:hypothetical protein HDU85_007268 [Gaertneriomyces sp. JEL0708]|nr:hypothetical protein HDU85_007268 [Gaertneriomyces sp. JEL0708]